MMIRVFLVLTLYMLGAINPFWVSAAQFERIETYQLPVSDILRAQTDVNGSSLSTTQSIHGFTVSKAWNLEKLAQIPLFYKTREFLTEMYWDPKGEYVVGRLDFSSSQVALWNVSTGKRIFALGNSGTGNPSYDLRVSWSDDGAYLAIKTASTAAHFNAVVLKRDSWEPVAGFENSLTLRWLPNSHRILSDEAGIQLHDLDSGQVSSVCHSCSDLLYHRYSRNGAWLAYVDQYPSYGESAAIVLKRANGRGPDFKQPLSEIPRGTPLNFSLSPAADSFVVVSERDHEKTAFYYRRRGNSFVKAWAAHLGLCEELNMADEGQIRWSEDGAWIAIGNGCAQLIASESGQHATEIEGNYPQDLVSVRFLSSRRMLTVSRDGVVNRWSY